MSAVVETAPESAIVERAKRRRPYSGRRIAFSGLSWRQYEMMLKVFKDQRLRHSFSNGTLEIMSPLYLHEREKCNLGRFLELLSFELNIDMYNGGSLTMKRRRSGKGLEADECFYIQNAKRVEGKKALDFETDPPPDLVVEIELTSSIVKRLPIYAKLGVPEVWRFDGKHLEVLLLDSTAKYHKSDTSRALPFLPMARVSTLIVEIDALPVNKWTRRVLEWIRQHVEAKWT
jgi:Uma2 family endonuclease